MTRRSSLLLLSLLGVPLALACSDGAAPVGPAAVSARQASAPQGGTTGFGFNGVAAGFPTGQVRLTGGGAYVVATASNTVPTPTSASASGAFDCVAAIAQGPLAGCAAGEGVRWDTAQLLASTGFKCTGADTPRTAVTGAGTAVLLADFYRAGDGDEASFRATIIISDTDLAPDLPGIQTLWVQGVGCGAANQHFNGAVE